MLFYTGTPCGVMLFSTWVWSKRIEKRDDQKFYIYEENADK
jgi:hypothetical protein